MVAMFLLGIYGRMIAYLPSWCVSLLSALVARVALMTSLRSRVERGMGRFPGIRDDDVEDLAQKHVRFLVDLFHQLFHFRYHHRPLHRVAGTVKREGEQYLTDALKDKRGAILVSLHLGNFFWSISYLASAYPANLVVRGESNPRWESFGATMRQKAGIETIYSTGAAIKIKQKLKKGEIVIFVLDQYLLPFFYGPDHPFREIVPRAARIGDAPVIPFYTLHDGNQVTVRFLPPFAEVSAARLEDMMMQAIKDHPHLWFWWRRLGKVKQGHRRS
jgi:KDO2-lipid IV(A) lauroyltransferase